MILTWKWLQVQPKRRSLNHFTPKEFSRLFIYLFQRDFKWFRIYNNENQWKANLYVKYIFCFSKHIKEIRLKSNFTIVIILTLLKLKGKFLLLLNKNCSLSLFGAAGTSLPIGHIYQISKKYAFFANWNIGFIPNIGDTF